jgi:transposase-like protein
LSSVTKNDLTGHHSGNSRNGYSSKTLKGDPGEVAFQAPRDRNGCFELQLIKKRQAYTTGMDDQILSLYAKGYQTSTTLAGWRQLTRSVL